MSESDVLTAAVLVVGISGMMVLTHFLKKTIKEQQLMSSYDESLWSLSTIVSQYTELKASNDKDDKRVLRLKRYLENMTRLLRNLQTKRERIAQRLDHDLLGESGAEESLQLLATWVEEEHVRFNQAYGSRWGRAADR